MLLIQHMSRLNVSTTKKAILSGCGITAIEYLCGLIWNKRYKVWDYRHMPYNIHGQICLPYTMLWCVLSAIVLKIECQIKKQLAE